MLVREGTTEKRDGFRAGMELLTSCLINYLVEKAIESEQKRQREAASRREKQQIDAHRLEFSRNCILCGSLTNNQPRDTYRIIKNSNIRGAYAPYHETIILENSIANDPEFYAIIAEALSQFAADSFDHNTGTVDDYESCHRLGLIQCVTPEDIVETCSYVPFVTFVPHKRDGLKNLVIANFREEFGKFFEKSSIGEKIKLLNMLSEYCKNLEPEDTGGWHGFMTRAFQHHPFIVSKPLHAKAVEILASLPDDHEVKLMAILRLGGFHLIMSILTATGMIMDFSGLKGVFCQFSAEPSALNALSGRAYSRGVRSHFLVPLGLSSIVLSMLDLSKEEVQKLDYLSQKVEDVDFTTDNEAPRSLKTKYEEKLE
ncbi:hypothetical protein QAD02_021898 [Eretmocerus hayati]|uniref:Uncharacterized protein n=1 Tax=Eretmocerus hayati TaxID=131215 RepID=A0ACC2PU05_9HYME|nr:hypothetical protein QAD02_021898 [Eretmocerus hayati]